MNKIYKILLPIIFLIFANCSDLKKGLGFEKDVPNEFLIKKLDPIEKPPNYDLLPPDSQANKEKDKKIKTGNSTKSFIEKSFNSTDKNNLSKNKSAKSSDIEESILRQIDSK